MLPFTKLSSSLPNIGNFSRSLTSRFRFRLLVALLASVWFFSFLFFLGLRHCWKSPIILVEISPIMATTEEIVQRLHESRPPATDAATYLTIVETYMSPEILPALQEILEDVSLTSDIGWDMVDMLIPIPGSEECLESIARLGNPREVILKVLEVMEKTTAAGEAEEAEQEAEDPKGAANLATKGETKASRHFVTLCGMLGILHRRLQVKAPSRFLHTTLETVLRCYDATSAAATAAVTSLVQSLAHKTRPPLPSRKSSVKLDTPFQDSDPTKQAPDPEADRTDTLDEDEPQLIASLLQSFITCIIEAYVNSNSIEWASRLLEYTYPERIVPGRKTMIQTFKEVVELQAKDALVGQLVVSVPRSLHIDRPQRRVFVRASTDLNIL